MKKKNLLKEIIVTLLIVSISLPTFVITGYSLNAKIMLNTDRASNTLIVDSLNNRIIEVDNSGSILWSYSTNLNNPMDVERLTNSNTLICDTWNNRVIEVDNSGMIVWSISSGLLVVFDAERLSNGNTLITDNNHNRVLEVDSSGITVWQKTGLNHPTDAERLSNGNTLITDCINNRIIEVDNSGSIVWSYSTGLNHPTDAERLSNGNTLIAGNNNNNIIEVDSSGTVVWSASTGLDHPHDAERLPNGNTVIADVNNNRVIEVDSSGTIVWNYSSGLNSPFDVERLANQPPNTPSIDGPTSGTAGTSYDYKISATDPDGDNVYYWVEWYDGCPGIYWDGPYNSGKEVILSYTYEKKGTFTITVVAKDVYDAKSETATLTVTMPRIKAINILFINHLQIYQNMFSFLQKFLNRLRK